MKNEEHLWIRENTEAFLAGGLEGEEAARFADHLRDCLPCREEFRLAREANERAQKIFAPAVPDSGFERRTLLGLRKKGRTKSAINPAVRRFSLGAAAALLLGAAGYFGQEIMEGRVPEFPLIASRVSHERHHLAKTISNDLEVSLHASEAHRGAEVRSQGELYPGKSALFASPEQMAQEQFQSMAVAFKSEAPEARSDSFFAFSSEPDASSHGRAVLDAPGWYANEREKQKITSDIQPSTEPPGTAGAGKSIYTYSDNKAPAGPSASSFFEPAEEGRKQDQNASAGPDELGAEASRGRKVPRGRGPLEPGGAFRENSEAGKGALESESIKVSDLDGRQGGETREEAAQGSSEGVPSPEVPKPSQKIIRSGEIEFEVESFDSAFVKVAQIANEEGGFIATTSSDKLPNGKVRGTVVVRVPPERLDLLVLKLRALGDLKRQRISSQDITKQYTDLESQLRGARAMEERLIQMIKTGQGKIKELLEAEKELGVWRTKIEQLEGEIRYYTNLVSLSTLTISLVEKDIKTPTSAAEKETVQMGLEAENVEKAHAEALEAIEKAKGRITRSELAKHDAGQLSAIIEAEAAPDAAGPLLDRLKQLGRVARLNVERHQETQGGAGRPKGIPIERKDTEFKISIYNLANVAPRETTFLNLAASNVEFSFQGILDRVRKANGRIVTSQLNKQKNHQSTANIHFEVSAEEAKGVLDDARTFGDTVSLSKTENPDTNNVTNSKKGFQVQLYDFGMVAPLETASLKLASRDVPSAYQRILQAVQEKEGRIVSSYLSEADKHNITGYLDFEIRRGFEGEVEAVLRAEGEPYSRNVTRETEKENVVNTKIRYQLNLQNSETLPPRETSTLGIEVQDVDREMAAVQALASEKGGRIVESHQSRQPNGRNLAKLVLDVPLSRGAEVLEKLKAAGTVRSVQSSRNPQVPEGSLARARFEVTLANADLILPSDQGIWATLRRGLSTSLSGLIWSLNLIVVGLCLVGPWALIGLGGWKLLRRKRATG